VQGGLRIQSPPPQSAIAFPFFLGLKCPLNLWKNNRERSMKIFRLNELEWIPASHENRQTPSVWKKVLLQKADLLEGRVQMVNWCRIEPGKAFHPHYHEDMEEVFIILKGNAKVFVPGEEADMREGEAVVIPPREVHEMKNTGEDDLEYLAMGISQGQGGKTVVA
jgi:mannose-6-phosphate isomerase-like protein (cupin superfamily)